MIELKHFSEDDLPAYLNALNKETAFSLFNFSGPNFSYPVTMSQIKSFIKNNQIDSVEMYTIWSVESNEQVGYVHLTDIDLINQSTMIKRFFIDKDHRGKGYGGEAIEKLKSIVFKDKQLHRLTLTVFDHNQSAARLYEKHGFEYEGKMRDARYFDRTFYTLNMMAIVDSSR